MKNANCDINVNVEAKVKMPNALSAGLHDVDGRDNVQ